MLKPDGKTWHLFNAGKSSVLNKILRTKKAFELGSDRVSKLSNTIGDNGSSVDRSRRGIIDKQILECLYYVNKSPLLYTTSSCAGRIQIQGIYQRCDQHSNVEQRSSPALRSYPLWLYQTHEKLPPEILKVLHDDCMNIFPGSQRDLSPALLNGLSEFDLTTEALSALAQDYSLRLGVPLQTTVTHHEESRQSFASNGGPSEQNSYQSARAENANLGRCLFQEDDVLLRLPALILARPALQKELIAITLVHQGPILHIITPTVFLAEGLCTIMQHNGIGKAVIYSIKDGKVVVSATSNLNVTERLWDRNVGWIIQPDALENIAQTASQKVEIEREKFIQGIHLALKEFSKNCQL